MKRERGKSEIEAERDGRRDGKREEGVEGGWEKENNSVITNKYTALTYCRLGNFHW